MKFNKLFLVLMVISFFNQKIVCANINKECGFRHDLADAISKCDLSKMKKLYDSMDNKLFNESIADVVNADVANLADMYNCDAIFKYLLQKSEVVKILELRSELYKATSNCDIISIKQLFETTDDKLLNAVVNAGLHRACRFKCDVIVDYLLNQGANIDAVIHGVTPLMVAARSGHDNVIDLLIKRGANVNLINHMYGVPVAGYALFARMPDSKHRAIKLLNSGTDINIKDSQGNSFLMNAIYHSHYPSKSEWTEFALELISRGADVNVKANDNVTALMLAAVNGQEKIVNALLERGAEVNLAAGELIDAHIRPGDTALILAAASGNINIVTKLIEHGAKLNAKNKFGSNALKKAAMNGHAQMVSKLLELGLNKDAKDNAGRTALDYAIKYERADVVSILKS